MIMETVLWGKAFLEAFKWHKHNIKTSLHGRTHEEVIVADLNIPEWRKLIKPELKNRFDHTKHTVKGITFCSNNDNLYFITNRGCKCVNCGVEATRLVVCRPTDKEIAKGARPFGYLRYIAKIGNSWYQLTVDHIKPSSKGGSDGDRNKQVLCIPCNQIKGCYPDVIPFHSYIIPKTTLKERLKMWKRLVIKWHYKARALIPTIGT